jgi:hypothetical protein
LIRSRSGNSKGIRTLRQQSSATELSIRLRGRSCVRSTATRRILHHEPARVPPATAEVAIAWRFVAGAVAVLTGGIAVAAIIALKTAIYLSRFNYH